MIIYEITAIVEASAEEEYERYMRERHVDDVLATGCFERASLAREEGGRYQIRCEATDHAAVERYRAEQADRLKADFAMHFGSGVAVSRAVWRVVRRWNEGAEVCR
jgi:hypothetical protein